jgi:hypothetical protein
MRSLLDLSLEGFGVSRSSPPEETSLAKSLFSSLAETISQYKDRLQEFLGPPNPTTDTMRQFGIHTPGTKAVLAAMNRAMGLMANVNEFVVEWRNLPSTSSAQSLITSAGQGFKSTLCKLTLSGHLSRLKTIVTLLDEVRLEVLDMELDFHSRDADEGLQNETALVESIVPFINQSKATLRCLRIVSHSFCDHANFFKAIKTFPTLSQIILHISFDHTQLSDLAGIIAFLRAHCYSLHHMEILPHRPLEHTELSSARQGWSQFCRRLAAFDPWFPNVESFCIASWNCADTLNIMRLLPSFMTSLRVAGSYLQKEQLVQLTSIVTEQVFALNSLALNVSLMDQDTLEILASRFPGLYALTLVVEKRPKIVSNS